MVKFTEEADAQLAEILSWLRRRSPRSAAELSTRVDKLIDQLHHSPYLGQRRYQSGVRAIPIRGYPYVVFYTVEADEVTVISVRHGARRPPRESDFP